MTELPRYLDLDPWAAGMIVRGTAIRAGSKTQHRLPLATPDGRPTEWAVLAAHAYEHGATGLSLLVREPWKYSLSGDPVLMGPYRYKSGIDRRVVANRDAAGLEPLACWLDPWSAAAEMPDDAPRLRLDLDWVHIVKLQSLSENNALDEGVWRGQVSATAEEYQFGYRASEDAASAHATARAAFAESWDVRYGAGAWDANPTVVAIGFHARIVSLWRTGPGAEQAA